MGCWNMIEIIYMEALSQKASFRGKKDKTELFSMFHMGSRTKKRRQELER